jgi:eukaryotic-like serine/threonine-protein kinase
MERVVALDDDPRILDLLALQLEPVCAVETFSDARVGLASILAKPPAAVITDVNMPGVPGTKIISEIRRAVGARLLPIVVLSAVGEEETILRCFELGATDYLLKPVPEAELRAKMAILLRRAEDAAGGNGVDGLVGRTFARHQVIRLLGRGGLGVVYEALAADGRRVALKVLRPDITDDRSLVRFLREAQMLKSVRHKNVARFYELGHDSLRYYISMEFVEGEPLNRWFRARPHLPEVEAVKLVSQVARALDALLQAGTVHRDLKPANVIIGTDGRVKIVDFSLGRRSTDEKITEHGLVVGTPACMSPEQCVGMGDVDIRSDLYSLGCIFFQLVSGQMPFAAADAPTLMAKHVNDRAPDPRSLNPNVDDETAEIIAKLLRKRPEERFQTPVELLAALDPLRRRLRGRSSSGELDAVVG